MKLQVLFSSLRVFGWLLLADIRFIWKDFFQNLLDAVAWPAAIIVVNGFVAPAMGLPADYGAFTTVSMMVIMGAYTAWAGSMEIAADLAGPQTISYELTLPLPYWMAWLKKGFALAIKTAVFNVTPLVVGKIILGDQFDLSHFSLIHFLCIYLVASLFFGMFALLSTVIVSTAESHSRLELRLIGPMFFLNGWTGSWAMMNSVSLFLGIFTRCLPWIYAYEGYRAAILGPQGYLNLWLCVGMLSMFTAVTIAMNVWLFKKRMDCL